MALPPQDIAPGNAPSLCTRCGSAFTCGAETGQPRCWCMDLPVLPAPEAGRSCYCPICLGELTANPPSR